MSRKTVLLIGFILLKFALQYVLLSPAYDLQRDEYLHLDQANHLAWGYLSVPPFTSWVSWVIKGLGNGELWVKFFPALFGALTLLLVWKAIEALNGNLFALFLGGTGVLFSALLRLNTLYQPNSFDVLAWAACYYTLLLYFKTEKPKWLYFMAVAFALGFLNKYNLAFLVIGFLPALLLTPHRRLLLNKHLYLALLLGLGLVLPNLFWQYQHQFPVVHHMQELSATQLVHVNRWDFLQSQVFFFLGSIFVLLASFYGLLLYRPFQKYRPFFWAFFFTLAAFLFFKAKDYYAIGLYPIYLAFGAVFLSNYLQNGWKTYLKPIAVAIPVLLFIPMYHLAFPNKSPQYIVAHQARYKAVGALRWEDGQDHAIPQDYADMLGWRELASKVDSVYAQVSTSGKTLVLCDNYGQAGAINYYSQKGIKAVSFNADYVNWFDLSTPYQHLIRVIEKEETEAEAKETGRHFTSTVVADSITDPYARERNTTIIAFKGAKVNINLLLQKEVEEVKSRR